MTSVLLLVMYIFLIRVATPTTAFVLKTATFRSKSSLGDVTP